MSSCGFETRDFGMYTNFCYNFLSSHHENLCLHIMAFYFRLHSIEFFICVDAVGKAPAVSYESAESKGYYVSFAFHTELNLQKRAKKAERCLLTESDAAKTMEIKLSSNLS